jgi:DNA-binding CsgD family transcriptional regulator
MGMNDPSFNLPPPTHQFNGAIDKFTRMQVELASEALKRAVDDMGAAMAHQLRDPLTSLLLYLHRIKHAADGGEIASALVHKVVDMALHEAERICEVTEQVGRSIDAGRAKAILERGSEAIESWAQRSVGGKGYAAPASPFASQQSLTPREREVLGLITGGTSNKEGGCRLGISTRTFEAHRAHLMAKLGARNAADLVRIATSEAQ